MKNAFRSLTGFLIAGPIALGYGLSSLFIGGEKALRLFGPVCTSLAKLGLRRFIPEIHNASEFDRFQQGLLANLDAWKSLYDVLVVQMDADTMKLKKQQRLQSNIESVFRSVILLTLLHCLSLSAGFNDALALVGDTEGALGLDGSFRIIGALSHNYDDPLLFEDNTDEFLQSILRLTAAGHPTRWLACEAHLVSALTYASAGTAAGGSGIGTQGGKTRYRALDKSWDFIDEEDDTFGSLWPDRFNVKLVLPNADLTMGRQAITLGKAYFWNPLDLYLPFDPAQFDRDYKAGVDAFRLDIPLGLFSGLNLIYVLGRELDINNQYLEDRTWDASWFGSSLLFRGFTHIGGWDLALQGGKVYGGWQMGGGLVGEIKTVQIRFEAARFWADGGPLLSPPTPMPLLEDHTTAVIGLGRRWPSSLDIEVECLYNGGGESDDITAGLERVERGVLLQAGRFLAGFTVSYEFTPLILGQLAVLQSLSDGSTQVQPTVRWSTSDNSELLLGASLNRGDRPIADPVADPIIQSEFGAYPHYLFAEFKIYF